MAGPGGSKRWLGNQPRKMQHSLGCCLAVHLEEVEEAIEDQCLQKALMAVARGTKLQAATNCLLLARSMLGFLQDQVWSSHRRLCVTSG